MVKCPHCGGEMDFEVKKQMVTCPYCRSDFMPEKLEATVKTAKERKNPNAVSGKSYTCSQCGATLMTFDDTAITFCSYCGSQAMLEDKVMREMNPDFVIPFMKTKEDCINEYKNVIKKNFFVPDYMKEDMVIEKFRGIFMPYAIYSLDFHGTNTSKGSKYSHRQGDYVIYDDYHINADLDVQYKGMSFDLSSNFYDQFSQSIPFNNKESKAFNANYLIGFYADASNVDAAVYDEDAESVTRTDSRSRLLKNREYSKYNCTNPMVDLTVSDRKIGLFPVYFLAIRDKKNENVSYAVVNGQTGKVAVDLPISYKKYVIASLIISAIVYIIVNAILVFTPQEVALISAIAGLISLIVSYAQVARIKDRKYHTKDKGYSYVDPSSDSEKKINKFKFLYKEILAMVIPFLVLLANFVEDAYYYFAAIISLLLVLISFRDLVEEHNLLTTNKLPQLEKRGGDEN